MKTTRLKWATHEMTILFSCLFFFYSDMASGAQWVKTYGNPLIESYGFPGDEEAASIHPTFDGGYILAGNSLLPINRPIKSGLILKLDSKGVLEWQRSFPREVVSIQQTLDSGYILLGRTSLCCGMAIDLWLAKLNIDGEIQWQKTYDELAHSIQPTSGGGFVIAGDFWVLGQSGNSDALVMKFAPGSEIQWQKAYGGAGNQWGNCVQQTSDGAYILTGIIDPFGNGNLRTWILKLDGNGNLDWQKIYGDPRNSSPYPKIQQASDGGFILLGNFYDSEASDVVALKLDKEGKIEWQRALGQWSVNSFDQTSDGGYIIAGDFFSDDPYNPLDTVLVRLDRDGKVQWSKIYKGIMHSTSINEVAEGQYVFTGTASAFGAEGFDISVLKVDGLGNVNECPLGQTSGVVSKDIDLTIKDAEMTGTDTNLLSRVETVTPSIPTLIESVTCPLPDTVAVTPVKIDFGDVSVGGSKEEVIIVSDVGNKDLTIDEITPPKSSLFAMIVDNCSNQVLPPGGSCTITLQFTPISLGESLGRFSIPIVSPVRSSVPIFLSGTGVGIALKSPLNGLFNACSIHSPPGFVWDTQETFKSYEIQFSPEESFDAAPIKIRTSGDSSGYVVHSNTWKKILGLPGTSGGKVYWRVVGKRADKTVAASAVETIIVEQNKPASNPNISPVTKSSIPALSWENGCNTKFKVWFGSDDNFSKKSSYTFIIKNPEVNGGQFTKSLTSNQWKSIRRLERDISGSTIYWYIESWDELGRYAKTDVMSFVLMD